MLRTTVVSLLALGCALSPATAQTVLWGEPVPQQRAPQGQNQPFYIQPGQLQPAPPVRQRTDPQPLYYESVPASPPVYVEPQRVPPPVVFQPPQAIDDPQPVRRFRPIEPQEFEPREFVPQAVPTRPLPPVEQFEAARPAPSAPAPVVIARPEPFVPEQPREAEPAVSARTDPPPQGPLSTADPDAVRSFATELARIVSLGERYRAASPGFLEDLKELAEKYETIPLEPKIVTVPAEPVGPPPPPLPLPPAAVVAEPPADEQPPETQLAIVEPEPELELPAALPEPESEIAAPVAEEPVELPESLPPTSAAIVYVRDDFDDGEYLSNPSWSVRQGQWTVDDAYGLRPVIATSPETAQVTPQTLLQYLISDSKPEANQGTGESGAALIEVPTDIGNAFSLVANIVDHGGEGAAHFIMHQGGANWLGYRLELRAGPRPLVVLARRGSSGYKDIMKVEAPGFTTGKPHQLRWARLSDGQMFVLIDGRPIITARDTVFRQGWKGFAYFTADADVSMRNIRIAQPVEQ